MADETKLPGNWRGPALALAAILAVAGYLLAPVLLGKKVEAFVVSRGELIQTVVASGRVETPARVEIGSQITGEVAAVPVAEGQTVKAGQSLIALEDSDERAAHDQARAAVAQAEAKLRQVSELQRPSAEQALAQAQATRANARAQHERSRDLAARGFVGKAQLDDAQRALDVAESQVRTAQLQLEAAQPGGSDTALARTALDQARASERVALAKLGHTVMKAPLDGTLIARSVERGDVVQPGKTLMVLSAAGRTLLTVQIDEKNLRHLKPGQRAFAAADAYPGQRFPAELVYINPGIDAQRGSVQVKLAVAEPPAFLRQDMTVSVEIEVARHAGALSLTTEAVHDAASAAPWVMLVAEGRARRRAVRLGIRGDSRVEVAEGLAEGDLVLPASGVQVAEGARVRAGVAAAR